MNVKNTSDKVVSFGVIFDGMLLYERFYDFNYLLSYFREFCESLSFKGYETFNIFCIHSNWLKQTAPLPISTLFVRYDWQKLYDDLIVDSHGYSEEDYRI